MKSFMNESVFLFPALKISSFFNMKKEGISKFYPIINNPENRLYVGTMAV